MFKKFSILIIAASLSSQMFAASPVSTYGLEVGDFTQLKVTSPVSVRYVSNPDSAGMIRYESTPDMASIISFTNTGEKLIVEFTTKGTHYIDAPTVTVYSNVLYSAENQSDSLIRLEKVAPCPELKLKIMGNGRISANDVTATKVSASITTGHGSIVISGKCDEANLSSISTGSIQAEELQAEIVNCKMMGTGEIGCWPEQKLTVSRLSMGTGHIYYNGNPRLIENKSINIKVDPIVHPGGVK
ncbi:MAG: DUF2807 domain-containing protein [Muribaculaceae bacterium]|nr:DUF2807 domain-containing protein [Muribaculaceae bacterium]MDE6644156.1 DUF2807 domain-containing protein [Muribaculaceae bacterium]